MVKQTIQIFARIKPTKPSKTGLYEIDEDEENHSRLQIIVPRELASGFVNNKKENYKFRYSKVFDQKASQEDVFASVAQPVIDNALQGFNGTIFAYGQTGSGKTFTITGGAERYADRGIIPRSLSYIYDLIEKHAEKMFTVHISYLEIYNENGYDLLDPQHEAAKLEDLPKVSLLEDADQNIHLKNLTLHQANSEEDALNLLFMGDTNRMIAETPMNQASSRSHCIFTVHLTCKEEGSATIRRAKLHLVDLAGSERVSKTGVHGTILTEAKYINLSLHFLEQVIIALAEKNRQHVPYRNSMMTSVLRDSLGGNCMTTMIATCSLEKSNIDESISTCRFAQRVAMVKNDVTLNEELDPRLLIAKLKREIAELKEQLAMATGQQLCEELTQEDIERCEKAVRVYIQDTDSESFLDMGHDLRKIQSCFKILKRYILEKPSASQLSLSRGITPPDTGPYRDAETQKLKDLVEQRDNEINILVNMLKRERARAADAQSAGLVNACQPTQQLAQARNRAPPNGYHGGRPKASSENGSYAAQRGHDIKPNHQETHNLRRNSSATIDVGDAMKAKILGKMSLGRQEAFDIFMRDYHDREKIETSKQILKNHYVEAKALGEHLNKSKEKMNHLKNSLAQYRAHYEMQGYRPQEGESEMETEIKKQMEEEKHTYKDTFTSLRAMKTKIEHMQHLLEKSKVKLMKDFELWWAQQLANNQHQAPAEMTNLTGTSDNVAWKSPSVTPPVSIPAPGLSSQRTFTRDTKFSANDTDSNFSRGSSASNLLTRPTVGGFVLTGDSKVDSDIEAFVKARQNILQKANASRR